MGSNRERNVESREWMLKRKKDGYGGAGPGGGEMGAAVGDFGIAGADFGDILVTLALRAG